MPADPPTFTVIEKFEVDHPELAAASDFFFRTNFFDSFMDVFCNYIDWRESGKRPNSFLNRQLKNWGIQTWIGEYPTSAVKKILASGSSKLQINDEATISVALSQLFYDRKIVAPDRKKALLCIDRQASDAVHHHLHYPDLESAKKNFAGLRKVIESKLG